VRLLVFLHVKSYQLKIYNEKLKMQKMAKKWLRPARESAKVVKKFIFLPFLKFFQKTGACLAEALKKRQPQKL